MQALKHTRCLWMGSRFALPGASKLQAPPSFPHTVYLMTFLQMQLRMGVLLQMINCKGHGRELMWPILKQT